MNEISHRTETATTTQTVETDDGKGNIMVEEIEVTATTLYITVTHKTTDEMADIYNFTADQREMLAELLAEENSGMWSAVLYGIGTGDGEIVAVALSQLGNVGGQPYWSWYGFESRVDWCACFVSWCANECGYLDTGVIPRFASCSIGIQWFRERGLWQDGDYEPRPGDLIFSIGTMRNTDRRYLYILPIFRWHFIHPPPPPIILRWWPGAYFSGTALEETLYHKKGICLSVQLLYRIWEISLPLFTEFGA